MEMVTGERGKGKGVTLNLSINPFQYPVVEVTKHSSKTEKQFHKSNLK